MSRVSLSFLVDTMDKRRGGCAPNIAYTLALLGERPRLMATAGQDFNDYRRWLEAAHVDTSLVREVDGKFTASFFCSTDVDSNQIASFYTGAMSNAGELSFRDVPDCGLAIISPNDPGAMLQYAGGVPHARDSVHLGSRPAMRADVRRRAPRRNDRRDDRDLERLRIRDDPAENRAGRGRRFCSEAALWSSPVGKMAARSSNGMLRLTCRPCRRIASSIRPASAMRSAAGS